MYEVIRWGSIAFLWFATGMNLYAFIGCKRSWKRYEKKENELEVERKYCATMIAACNKFLEAAHKESEVTEEATDGLA